ncbi:MAG TPA: hypothetical protein VKF40_27385 [Burkholderiales bacterium]|nr:hypothetical protein [Burkholderiales bacterium]
MNSVNTNDKAPDDVAGEFAAHGRVVQLVGLAFAAAVGLAIYLTADPARSSRLPVAAAAPAATDSSRFILNAFLVPALDIDVQPLRWVDPQSASLCGPNTTVRVNGEPLLAGALVPNAPFELEWQADECRPFGAGGPRFDGAVKLTVFREDWGFSAIVEPSGLRVTSVKNSALIQPGAASLHTDAEADNTVQLTALRETAH